MTCRLRRRTIAAIALAGLLLAATPVPTTAAGAPVDRDPFFDRWETLRVADGLPSDKVFAVEVQGDVVWAGTEKGLAAVRADGIEVYTRADGLPFDVISALAVDRLTGDLWIGTLGGVARFSAGRFDAFTQLDSGLANDVIYGLTVTEGRLWIATAAGLNSYDPATDSWQIFDTTNTLMHEPWCYGVTADGPIVYVAVWGGGVLVHDTRDGSFREHRDPDGEMEVDLFRDDGLVHDVTSGVTLGGDILWVGTYFGLSRYDGRRWNSYAEEDSGLASNFINTVRADDEGVWIGTDRGLVYFDSQNWWTWHRRESDGTPEVRIAPAGQQATAVALPSGIPDNSVLGIAFDDGDLWIATASGLAHASRSADRAAPVTPPTAGADK